MKDTVHPRFPTRLGYMTETTQRNYIATAITKGVLPDNAHRVAEIVSLTASQTASKPIQFWQLYSVLGQKPVVTIVKNFYARVFDDEKWFSSVFENVGGIGHHVNTQAAMWIDVMGGGPYYHGAEFRLNFHHTHNAMQLMNEKGADRWSHLMLATLNDSAKQMTDDPRVRTSINTFLMHFMAKYASDFNFENRSFFGETNPPFKQKINFLKMSQDAINALTFDELSSALADQNVDVSQYATKQEMIEKALMM